MQVLSSKLMPTLNRDGGANARMFKEHFLAAGGLRSVNSEPLVFVMIYKQTFL